MNVRPLATLLCLFAIMNPAQAADPHLARNLAATCANCHGTNGHSVPNTLSHPLAGLPQSHLMQKMAEFRNGSRPATIMHQIVKGYSEAQLELIAGYFAAQPVGTQP